MARKRLFSCDNKIWCKSDDQCNFDQALKRWEKNGRMLRCYRISPRYSGNSRHNDCARREKQIRHYLSCDSTPVNGAAIKSPFFIGRMDDMNYLMSLSQFDGGYISIELTS